MTNCENLIQFHCLDLRCLIQPSAGCPTLVSVSLELPMLHNRWSQALIFEILPLYTTVKLFSLLYLWNGPSEAHLLSDRINMSLPCKWPWVCPSFIWDVKREHHHFCSLLLPDFSWFFCRPQVHVQHLLHDYTPCRFRINSGRRVLCWIELEVKMWGPSKFHTAES